jgi:hypothetical protein
VHVEGLPIVLFVLLFVGIAALAIWAAINAKKKADARRAMIAAFAASRGWVYRGGQFTPAQASINGLGPFGTGDNRYGENYVAGEMGGVRVEMFDYHYQVTRVVTDGKGHMRTQTDHCWSTPCILTMPEFFPVGLMVRPENFFDKIGSVFGADDIDFESHEFSKKFWVKCADRKLAYDVIHAKTMEYLLANPGVRVEVSGNMIVAQHGSGTLAGEQWPWLADFAAGFHGLFPEYLKDRLRAEGR